MESTSDGLKELICKLTTLLQFVLSESSGAESSVSTSVVDIIALVSKTTHSYKAYQQEREAKEKKLATCLIEMENLARRQRADILAYREKLSRPHIEKGTNTDPDICVNCVAKDASIAKFQQINERKEAELIELRNQLKKSKVLIQAQQIMIDDLNARISALKSCKDDSSGGNNITPNNDLNSWQEIFPPAQPKSSASAGVEGAQKPPLPPARHRYEDAELEGSDGDEGDDSEVPPPPPPPSYETLPHEDRRDSSQRPQHTAYAEYHSRYDEMEGYSAWEGRALDGSPASPDSCESSGSSIWWEETGRVNDSMDSLRSDDDHHGYHEGASNRSCYAQQEKDHGGSAHVFVSDDFGEQSQLGMREREEHDEVRNDEDEEEEEEGDDWDHRYSEDGSSLTESHWAGADEGKRRGARAASAGGPEQQRWLQWQAHQQSPPGGESGIVLADVSVEDSFSMVQNYYRQPS